MKLKTTKMMIVCSEVNDDLESQLVCDGWVVIWASDAKAAIAKVRRERFDLAVLISTGNEMDVTETLFNLRDIRSSMPIVVVQQSNDIQNALSIESFLSPDADVLAVQDLSDLVSLLKKQESPDVRQSAIGRAQP